MNKLLEVSIPVFWAIVFVIAFYIQIAISSVDVGFRYVGF